MIIDLKYTDATEHGKDADDVITGQHENVWTNKLYAMKGSEELDNDALNGESIFGALDVFLDQSDTTYAEVQNIFDKIDTLGVDDGKLTVDDFNALTAEDIAEIKEDIVDASDNLSLAQLEERAQEKEAGGNTSEATDHEVARTDVRASQ